MKILIAYDGSGCSESALDDLSRAGLPAHAEVLVVSVAEVWLAAPARHQEFAGTVGKAESYHPFPGNNHSNGSAATEALTFAHHAERRLRATFPEWDISSEALDGSPAREIIRRADAFKPDLIVMGSTGRSYVGRLLIGSISQKVLNESKFTVRVARGRVEVDSAPIRIVIGYDGSKGSRAAVEAVARRNWPEGSEVRLIAATELVVPTTIGRFISPVVEWADQEMKAAGDWVRKMAVPDLKTLRDAGLEVSMQVFQGNPKQILVDESQSWDADSIFLGANSFGSKLDRFLMGSTSSAVAERARCSVEVVNQPH